MRRLQAVYQRLAEALVGTSDLSKAWSFRLSLCIRKECEAADGATLSKQQGRGDYPSRVGYLQLFLQIPEMESGLLRYVRTSVHM